MSILRLNFNSRALLLSLALGSLACGGKEPEPPAPVEEDTEAPLITLTSPQEGARPATWRVHVTGSVRDVSGITGLSWKLNTDAPVELAPQGATSQTLDFELQPRPGANTLVVAAGDSHGNTREASVSFVFGSQTGAGGLHSGVIRRGTLYTWGRNNRGQLGIGSTTDSPTPVKVESPSDVAALVLVQNNSLALQADGSVWMWGDNSSGQLGQGQPGTLDTALRDVPTRVPGITDAVMGALGYSHALVLHRDGHVSAFGENNNGQLGDGTTEDRHYPVPVQGLTDIIRVIGGSQHSAALRADGTVWVWGRNGYGNLGNGAADADSHPVPTQVPGLANVVDLAGGRDHLLALHQDGTVSAWGLNASGQLGDGQGGKDSQRASPAPVHVLTDATAVHAQANMSFARRQDGSVWGWGQNFNGQLGTGDTTELSVPTTPVLLRVEPPEPLSGLLDVAPGATHVVAQHRDGTVYAWGWNSKGSLGRTALLENWAYPLPQQVELP
ncbi:RCC1-like domain-containing protein [Melittangium boletus]|nr:RCC1 domain-containing protein [Melittangium boletus]